MATSIIGPVIITTLVKLAEELATGALVTIEAQRTRVRVLPL
jgi:hypothetical protein